MNPMIAAPHRFDAETAHNISLKMLKFFPPIPYLASPVSLNQTIWGRRFDNPLGIAAGYDKNAEVIKPLYRLGFGHNEFGSVTPSPQAGNPKPRCFRLPEDRAIINRMGFNNKGLDYFVANLTANQAVRKQRVLGINICKNTATPAETALADYVQCLTKTAALVDYCVINVSSPNMAGLRDLQNQDALQALLQGCKQAVQDLALPNPPALLVKLAPDLTDTALSQAISVIQTIGLDGVVLTNTALFRPESLRSQNKNEKGGLSGPPLRERSTAMIKLAYRTTAGKLTIIGSGGIDSAEAAYQKIRAGASLLQLYTGLVYAGPALIGTIKKGLVRLLQQDGFKSITEAIGVDAAA